MPSGAPAGRAHRCCRPLLDPPPRTLPAPQPLLSEAELLSLPPPKFEVTLLPPGSCDPAHVVGGGAASGLEAAAAAACAFHRLQAAMSGAPAEDDAPGASGGRGAEAGANGGWPCGGTRARGRGRACRRWRPCRSA